MKTLQTPLPRNSEPQTEKRSTISKQSPVKFMTKIQGVQVDIKNRENPFVNLEKQLVKISEFESLVSNTEKTKENVRIEENAYNEENPENGPLMPPQHDITSGEP